jgi:hypothetical protein
MLRILCEIPNLVIAVGLRALVGRRVRLCGLAAAVAVQPEQRAEGACEKRPFAQIFYVCPEPVLAK